MFYLFFPINLLCSFKECPVSLLDLFHREGLQKVELPYLYYHMMETDKISSTFLLEGNYTILTPKKYALVGPLRPCQLFFLEIPLKSFIMIKANKKN